MAYKTTSYESFYNGTPSSLDPEYGDFGAIGYRMNASNLGFPGSPQTANQLGETVNALKQGVKAFEVSLLGVQDADQAIPKQHFKEMRALMKLSGVKPSVHGPLIDAAGFGEKGWGGDEAREDNERKMLQAVERAHELDPNGNIPVVFHSSNGTPGPEFRPGDPDKGEEKFIIQKDFAVNRETGQLAPLKREYKFRPERPDLLEKGGKLFTTESQVNSVNLGEWENKLTELAQLNKHAEEIIQPFSVNTHLAEYKNAGVGENGKFYDLKTGEEIQGFDSKGIQAQEYGRLKKAEIFLENAELGFIGAFHQAYKYGTEEQRKKLKEISENYQKNNESLGPVVNKKGIRIEPLWQTIQKKENLERSIEKLKATTGRNGPEIFQQVEKFAMDKAADTFGNLAEKSYEKFGEKAPIIAIENMYQGMGFSRAEDLKELVEKSREKFTKKLMKDGISEGKAKKIAEKQIGVTWDVGHLNLLRKTGFKEEDILKETEIITKDNSMVKHVHLTDNFGFSDSHLAPGMGNVPIKKILEQLEKTGRLSEMRKIVESGAMVQHFKKSPHPWTLSAFGSPIYGMQMGPYWNQAMDTMGGYFGGYGTINPQQHHSIYGAGFTTMPLELGGQMPGGQSRFGGTPMA